jgi:transformation/transcription domain-associated protein
MGKTYNLWHVALPIIENHMNVYPDNERYFFAMNELYEKLSETDYIAGLRRFVTKSPEMRSMISYA